ARFMYTIFSRFSVANAIGLRDAIMWILIVLGISSGLVGALLMVVQRDVKRLLAYSTISHIGLIFMGLGLGLSTAPSSATEAGLTAALYHTLNHSVGKALLFMAVGVMIWAAGTRDIDGLAGTGRLYPGAAAAMVIGFLQLMGMPPLGGFFSKLMLYQAYVEAGMLIPAVMVVVISAISILGYMKVIYSVVFRPPSPHVRRGSTYMATGVVLFMAALCIALGLAAPFLAPYLTKAVGTSLMPQGIRIYVQAFVDALRVLSPRG
ncbi:MAG: cation:proton antiporter, partial [Thermoprotei archaeon]